MSLETTPSKKVINDAAVATTVTALLTRVTGRLGHREPQDGIARQDAKARLRSQQGELGSEIRRR